MKQDVNPLQLLSEYLDQGVDTIMPTTAPPEERPVLQRLHEMGALKASTVPPPLQCPSCLGEVHILSTGRTWCPECGNVNIDPADQVMWAPDGVWLLRRMAQALGLAGTAPVSMIPERVWRMGDVGTGPRRRRVVYGQQLKDVAVQRELHAVWTTHVGNVPSVLITTTPQERLLLMVPAQIVPVASAFQLQGTGLIADGPVWEGVLATSQPVESDVRHGPFSPDFGEVQLPGDPDAISLTKLQSEVFRRLWELNGARIDGEKLMRQCGSDSEKPVYAFKRARHPDAHRAYRHLVRNDRNEYWMPRSE